MRETQHPQQEETLQRFATRVAYERLIYKHDGESRCLLGTGALLDAWMTGVVRMTHGVTSTGTKQPKNVSSCKPLHP
jgi:hypothetical protein